MLLSLDISTSIMGYCFLDPKTGKIIDIGDINFKKCKTIFDKMVLIEKWFETCSKISNVSNIVVEAPLLRFAGGKSNAGTLFKLYAFNIFVQFVIFRKFGFTAQEIGATMARKRLGIVVPKKTGYKERKKIVFDQAMSLANSDFGCIKTKKNNWKEGSFDRADAWVIGEAFRRKV